ncbi:uncharacterized protein LOC135142839 [Zophobas morio]|uniref:uncharacterized protein LOC135142839 n=1 Tax=Zophobas morio TaxID=2755281 RepID=UPI0030835EAE
MGKLFIVLIFLPIVYGINFKKDYILDSPKCKIPEIDPFNEEFLKIRMIRRDPYLRCNKTEILSYVDRNSDNVTVLHLKKPFPLINGTRSFDCCYSYITRKGSRDLPDVGFKTSQCIPFQNDTVLTQDTVNVTCTKKSTVIYQNVHNIIRINETMIKEKMRNAPPKPLSVLIIGIDSISRLNFIRTMPQTYAFLAKNNFIEMKGYTKIADNTYENLVSLLTGLRLNEIPQKCQDQKIGGLDRCPMIWKNFSSNGYITAFVEDAIRISTFNYNKMGFSEPPTDYYFKPYMEAAEALGVRIYHKLPYCAGPGTSAERVLNLARDFVTTFKNQSTFGIFWMSSFSHNYLRVPYSMDKKVKEFFADLKKEGILNNTMVIVLSDHGIRFGEIRKTRGGWFEERMPINMISVPRTFRQNLSREYQNVRKNRNKLISTYDMFVTLEHVLTLSETGYKRKGSSACKKCVSLLEEIPRDRSCEDAGISTEWCTCGGHFRPLDIKDDFVERAANHAIDKLNNWPLVKETCTDVFLSRIVSASVSESISDTGTKYLFLVIETKPTDFYLTTIKFNQIVPKNSTFFIRGINNYPLCINDYDNKLKNIQKKRS